MQHQRRPVVTREGAREAHQATHLKRRRLRLACDADIHVRPSRRMDRGFVLTIDYGHEAADLLDSHHMTGTLLAYAKHQASESFYAAPGEQDLTAHVNFTALRLQLKTLIYPEGMGERFQVLVQQKAVPAAELAALSSL